MKESVGSIIAIFDWVLERDKNSLNSINMDSSSENTDLDVFFSNVLENEIEKREVYRNEINSFACVLMWHTIENIILTILKEYSLDEEESKKQGINHFKAIFKEYSSAKLQDIPEFATCNILRLINNCYKHNRNLATKQLVEARLELDSNNPISLISVKAGSIIELNRNQIEAFIEPVRIFCKALANCDFALDDTKINKPKEQDVLPIQRMV